MPILFWGFLIMIMVEWAPEPYSNYKAPILPNLGLGEGVGWFRVSQNLKP